MHDVICGLSFVRRRQQPHNDVCTSIALARPHSYSHALPVYVVAALPNPATVANGIRGSERLTLRTTKLTLLSRFSGKFILEDEIAVMA